MTAALVDPQGILGRRLSSVISGKSAAQPATLRTDAYIAPEQCRVREVPSLGRGRWRNVQARSPSTGSQGGLSSPPPPPRQSKGEALLGEKDYFMCDAWSYGIILFELLTTQAGITAV